MSLEMNANLTKLNNIAVVAARHENLSGEDSVIQGPVAGQTKIFACKWKMLGARSSEFKQGNLAARCAFFESVCDQFGGFDKIPDSVKAVMKLDDFKLNAEGKVTSLRPLTSRRITTVCDAIREYNRTHDPMRFKAEKAADFDKLPASMQDDYRGFVARQAKALSEAGSTDIGKLSVMSFLKMRLSHLRAQSESVPKAAQTTFMTIVDTLKEDFAAGEVSHVSGACLTLAETLLTEHQSVLALVRERAAALPAKDQALLFQECVSKLEARVTDLMRNIYLHQDEFSKDVAATAEAILADVDFTEVPASATLTLGGVCDFMKAFVDKHRVEFTNTAGNVNEKFSGKCGNKYENLIGALRCFKDLKSDTELAGMIKTAIAESHTFVGSKREAAYLGMIEKARARAKEKNEHFTEPIRNPCHAMSTGKQIDTRLQKIMGTASHTRSNTAVEIGEAYEIFCNLSTFFFQALDEDREKGDTRLFDMLMDALNTTGCLQARCEALLNVRIALDPEVRDVEDNTISNLPIITGFGMVAQSLQANGNDEVDYGAAVKLYVEKMAQAGKPGVATLGVDVDGLGKKDTPVEITVDYFMNPEVAMIFKNIFVIFKD